MRRGDGHDDGDECDCGGNYCDGGHHDGGIDENVGDGSW